MRTSRIPDDTGFDIGFRVDTGFTPSSFQPLLCGMQ